MSEGTGSGASRESHVQQGDSAPLLPHSQISAFLTAPLPGWGNRTFLLLDYFVSTLTRLSLPEGMAP